MEYGKKKPPNTDPFCYECKFGPSKTDVVFKNFKDMNTHLIEVHDTLRFPTEGHIRRKSAGAVKWPYILWAP